MSRNSIKITFNGKENTRKMNKKEETTKKKEKKENVRPNKFIENQQCDNQCPI